MDNSCQNKNQKESIPSFGNLKVNSNVFNSERTPRIYNNIIEVIGNTPLVKLNKIPKLYGLTCDILVKCEYLNPSGSLKDRIAKRMIEEAEKNKEIDHDYTLIEPSSGNTGIGLALVSAVKGYKCTIVMTKKMSCEKERIMRSLGTNVVRTEIGKRRGEKGNCEVVARELNEAIPKSIILNQYLNPYNPKEHYDITAEEILYDCGDKLDMVVAGTGTGGTLTGLSRKIKEKLPKCKIVGVDAEGSVLNQISKIENFSYFDVEGIGHDYKPYVLSYDLVDKWYSVKDKDSFTMSRQLIRLEGLLVGGSSGSTLWSAIQACKEYGLKEGDRCVVILADSIRNYMTKFIDDDWMKERKYLDN